MSDNKHFGVYDLLGSQTYYYYSAVGKEHVVLEESTPLHTTLISPKNQGTNKADYIVSKEDCNLEDIISKNIAGNAIFEANNSYPMEFMLMGLTKNLVRDANRTFKIASSLTADRNLQNTCYQKLSNWFRYQKALLDSVNNEKNGRVHNPDQTIITISDDASYEYQEKILAAMNERRKCTLLWRSVAAAIGAEEYFEKFHLKDGDIISIYDRTSVDIRITNLELKECNGKLIPGHHLYSTNDHPGPIKLWFPNETHYGYYDQTPFLEYDFDSEGFITHREKINSKTFHINKVNVANSKLVLVIGPGIVFEPEPKFIADPSGELVNIGAGRFANRMSNKITSYYDECESFSMVVQEKDEENVIFKDLIKATTMLTGGLVVEEEPIYDVSFDVMNPKLDFYLRLGKKSPKLPLKLLSQKLELNVEDEDTPKKIPLCLQPTMIAGQGRAKVYVKAAHKEHAEFFSPVELNWEFMADAKERNGSPTTLEILQANIPRSYPVNVPTPKADRYKLRKAVYDMYKFLNGMIDLDSIELNHPEMPFKYENSVEKFQKINTMGVDWDKVCSAQEKIIIEQFCHQMTKQAIMGPDQNIALRHIGWTYNRSGVYAHLIEILVSEIEKSAKFGGVLSIQKSTICANIINDDELLVRFFHAFQNRLKKPLVKLTYWLRSLSLILMYNINFLSSDKIKPSDVNFCVARIYSYYFNEAMGHPQMQLYAIKTLIFLLKYRRAYKNFAKPNSPNAEDKKTYDYMNAISVNLQFAVTETAKRHLNMLGNFLEGKGTIEVPEPDD